MFQCQLCVYTIPPRCRVETVPFNGVDRHVRVDGNDIGLRRTFAGKLQRPDVVVVSVVAPEPAGRAEARPLRERAGSRLGASVP